MLPEVATVRGRKVLSIRYLSSTYNISNISKQSTHPFEILPFFIHPLFLWHCSSFHSASGSSFGRVSFHACWEDPISWTDHRAGGADLQLIRQTEQEVFSSSG